MNPTRKIFRGATIFFLASILAAGLGYGIRILFARSLTPAEYGLFYAVLGFVSFFSGFKALGVNSAAVKYFAEFAAHNQDQHIKNTARYLLLVQLIVFIPLVILGAIFADYLAINYFKDAAAAPILIIILLAFLLSILETLFTALFQGLQHIKSFSTVDSIGNLLILGIAYILFKFMHGAIVPAYAYLGSFLLVPIVYIVLLKKVYPQFFRTKAQPDRPLLHRLFNYGLPLTGGIVATSLLASADTLILTYFRTLQEVGYYQVALPVVALLRYFGKSVSVIILPLSSELFVTNKKELSLSVAHVLRIIIVIITPLALAVSVYAESIIRILFGTAYLSAVPALQILGISAILGTISILTINVLLGIGDVKSQAFAYIFGAAVTVILDLFLIPSLGIAGAALGTTLGGLAMVCYSAYRLTTQLTKPIPLFDWAKTIIAASAFVLVAQLFNGIFLLPIVDILVGSIAAGLVYLGIILFLRVLTFKEIKRLFERVRA